MIVAGGKLTLPSEETAIIEGSIPAWRATVRQHPFIKEGRTDGMKAASTKGMEGSTSSISLAFPN